MINQNCLNKPLIAFDNSDDALKILQHFRIMKDKYYESFFVHVHNPLKNFIPPQYRGQGVIKIIVDEFEKDSKIRIDSKAIQEGKTVNSMILQNYLIQKCNFMFLGFTGTKGRKVRDIDLSSRVREFSYDSKIDLAIIKNSPNNSKKALFCCDGSQISFQGLKKALYFCKQQGFKLTILHATNSDRIKYGKQLKIQLKKMLTGIDENMYEIIVVQADLLQHLKCCQSQYQWIILNKNGFRGEITKKSYVGAKASQVLWKISCNLLLLH